MRLRLALLSMLALAGTTARAETILIDPISYAPCLGQASCGIGSATLTAGTTAAARFAEQDFRDTRGLGVDLLPGGANRPELQGPRGTGGMAGIGESITIDFADAVTIDSVTLAHFYNPRAFGGDPRELAILTAYSETDSATLAITNLNYSGGLGVGFTVNDASLFDSIERLAFAGSPTGNSNAGLFEISGLFEELGGIVRLVFTAGAVPSGDTSDYSIASLVATTLPGGPGPDVEIPAPGAGFLLLAGLLGLAGVRARR